MNIIIILKTIYTLIILAFAAYLIIESLLAKDMVWIMLLPILVIALIPMLITSDRCINSEDDSDDNSDNDEFTRAYGDL